MHPLYDVSTVIENAANVLSVHSTREMGIAVVFSITTGCTYPLEKETDIYHHMMHLHMKNFMVTMFTIAWCLKHPPSHYYY